MIRPRKLARADRRLLPEGRLAGPMPWVIAIMMFLTLLAAAGGLALAGTARGLETGNRITVQIVEADPAARARQAEAAAEILEEQPGVLAVDRLEEEEVEALLAPWLGESGIGDEIPVPALIDAELDAGGEARIEAIERALREAAPAARVDDNAAWLAPLARLLAVLEWLAFAIVLLMGVATAAVVVLAARGALDTHRATIEVLHLLGATDIQVARLFQRRIALDAAFGALLGLAAAVLALLLVGRSIAALGSDLFGVAAPGWTMFVLLGLFPLGGIALATVIARLTILRALGRIL